MKELKMRVVLLFLLLLPAYAFATPVNITWTHPTTYTDGSALPIADLASTRIEYGTCNGTAFGTKAGEQVINAPASGATVDRPPGTWCFRAFSKVIAARGGLESNASPTAQGIVPFPTPSAPGSVTVTVVVTIQP